METSNPYAPPVAPVRDVRPDGTTLELASRGSRLGAYLLDGLIATLLVYVPMLFVINMGELITSDRKLNYGALLAAPVLLSALPGLILWVSITIWLVVRNGQTIAKKLVGIKVVRTNGARAGLGRIFWLRNVVMGVISIIPIVGGIAALVDSLLIFRESRKCLHDQIADTIVIRA